jgi:hypothetical protein
MVRTMTQARHVRAAAGSRVPGLPLVTRETILVSGAVRQSIAAGHLVLDPTTPIWLRVSQRVRDVVGRVHEAGTTV